MSIPYVEYIVFGVVLTAAIVTTFALTKRKYRPNTTVDKVGGTTSCCTKDVTAKLASAVPPTIPAPTLPTSVVVKPNHWKLEVNGDAKFDIKVEWSDGDVMIFSGQAPTVYTVDQEKGVVPINTAGIPPEWADDGISYQWRLNDHLWC